MFTEFYCKLELRSELWESHGNGEKTLILYHARARREWFDSIWCKTPFDISIIHEPWMTEAHKKMWDGVHMQEIQKAGEKVKLKFNNKETWRSSLPSTPLTCTLPPSPMPHSTLHNPCFINHAYLPHYHTTPLHHCTLSLPHCHIISSSNWSMPHTIWPASSRLIASLPHASYQIIAHLASWLGFTMDLM